MSNRNITTTPVAGSAVCGTAFDDNIGIPDLNKTAICRIVVTYEKYIRSLTVSRQQLK